MHIERLDSSRGHDEAAYLDGPCWFLVHDVGMVWTRVCVEA